jgi:hypothetical protein
MSHTVHTPQTAATGGAQKSVGLAYLLCRTGVGIS